MLSGISRVSYTRKVFLSVIEKSFYIGLFALMTHEKTHLISSGNTDARFHDFQHNFHHLSDQNGYKTVPSDLVGWPKSDPTPRTY